MSTVTSEPRDNFPHTITRASAGSGKTFALSNRYLGLVHHGQPPERILATTFARKAAGEILDRILIRLAEAAGDAEKLAELSQFIGDGQPLTEGRCRELLRELAGNLHKLRVGTIDSFFAQVARSFALELGIPPGWQIIDAVEDAALRDQAIEAVLASQSRSDLLHLVNLLTQGDAQRSVSQLLRDTVGDLYQVYLDSDAAAWERLPRYKPLGDDELTEALEALRTLPLAANALKKGRDGDYDRALSGDWKKFLGAGLAKCVVQGKDKYYRQTLEPHVVEVYQRLIDHAQAVLLGRTANFTTGARQFLAHFHDHYRRIKHRRRVMLFDDVTRAVVEAANISDADGLAFRLDAHVDHLLLDEFQDTSPAQWTAIRPLAERIVAEERRARRAAETPRTNGSASASPSQRTERTATESSGGLTSFFCVGDVKQAIYGWRGGVAEIFNSVQQQLGDLREESLAKSYRSSPVIIETVNTVFQNLTSHPNLGRSEDAILAFQNAFPHHQTAKTDLPGYACLRTAPADDDDQTAATLRYTAKYIAGLLRDSPGRSVGVLCLKNKTIAALIYELRELGINASEEGGNPLTDSAAVQLLLALLKLADHPGDTIARHHLATSALAEKLRIHSRGDDAAALRISQNVRRDLLQDGYGPTLQRWAEWLAPECNSREWSRLEQLVELAYGYQATVTLRTRDFLRLLEGQQVADPTAHPVRVTTVFRAKGLEFDIVVLPELDTDITRQTPAFVIHRENETGPIDCVFRYVSQDLQPLLPAEFRQMIEAATHRAVTETMCVLYVAMTRPVHALHMIIPPSREKERNVPAKLSGLLRCALKDAERVGAEEIIWETGDPRWLDSSRHAPRATAVGGKATAQAATDQADPAGTVRATEPLVVRVAPPVAGPARSLDRIAPSRLHAGNRVSVADVFAEAENSYARDRGSLIHACFEQIEWLDDGPPEREALRRVVAAHGSPSVNVDSVLDEFYDMLTRGQAAEILSRSHYLPPEGEASEPTFVPRLLAQPGLRAPDSKLDPSQLTCSVSREHEFAFTDDENHLVQGSIDRLVLLYHGEDLIAADIIDFKTDADTTHAATADRHREQLAAYRSAAARILKLPPERIATRLLMVKDGSVVNIDH